MSNVRCPSCRQLISLTERPHGQTVKCPACGEEFQAADAGDIVAGLPSPGDAAIQTPAERYRDDDAFEDLNIDAGPWKWRWTATGLMLVWWGALGYMVLSLAISIVMLVSPIDFDPNQPPQAGPFPVAIVGFGCLSILIGIVIFVGMCMSATGPDSKARQYAIASCVSGVLCVGAALLFGVVVMTAAVQHLQRQGGAPKALDGAALMEIMGGWMIVAIIVQVLLATLAILFWCLFHVAVATHFQDAALRRWALITMAVWVVAMPFNYALTNVPAAHLGMDEFTKLRLQSVAGIGVNLVLYTLYLLVCAWTIAVLRSELSNESRRA
jgi:hypothetical protein